LAVRHTRDRLEPGLRRGEALLTVTNNKDSGPGSLRATVAAATSGAIESFGFPPDQLYGSTLNLSNCQFTGNQAIGASGLDFAEGGAVDLQFGVVATISQSGSGGSDGDGIGGGLYIATGGSVTLKKSQVVLNLASTSNDNIFGTVM
jgi:hypothetical protein